MYWSRLDNVHIQRQLLTVWCAVYRLAQRQRASVHNSGLHPGLGLFLSCEANLVAIPKKKGFTKKITQRGNKGDTVEFKIAPGGKPYPVRVVKDVGNDSSLKKSIPRGRKRG